jgi:hypothetical protein
MFPPTTRVKPAGLERLEEFMGRALRFVEPLEQRALRSATVELTDPGHNLHVTVAQTINIDPTSPLDTDYVKPLSVKWDLNYDGDHVDSDLTGEQPRVAFDHAGHFVVAGEFVYGDHTELHTFAVDVTDFATEASDPMIHVAAPDHAAPDELVTLTLTTDHAGQTLQYILEDGSGYTGPAGEPAELTHTFAGPGTYNLKIQLYVDGVYVGYASHSVTIASNSAPEVTPTPEQLAYVSRPTAPPPLAVSQDDAEEIDLLA